MRWFGRPYMTIAPRFVISTCSTLFTILFSLSIKPQDSFTSLSLFSSGQLRLLSLSLSLSIFSFHNAHPFKLNLNTKIFL
jgi:hypothetical protein